MEEHMGLEFSGRCATAMKETPRGMLEILPVSWVFTPHDMKRD
jgi:hypothetical protein